MKKLVNGIVQFRQNLRAEYKETFARLALGQSPDTLFITCSDSRVAVNVFASTDPGDLFVIRNVGNMVPPCGTNGVSTSNGSEAAALEFALSQLNVANIIICGHSECGAMRAIVAGKENVATPNLRSWLHHGEESLALLNEKPTFAAGHTNYNRLSQFNVLKQIEHLKSYPIVQKRLADQTLKLYGWWFELSRAEVYAYEESLGKFVVIDEKLAAQITARL